jgi:hypothetical protein
LLDSGTLLGRAAVQFDPMMAVLAALEPQAALAHAAYMVPERIKHSSLSRRLQPTRRRGDNSNDSGNGGGGGDGGGGRGGGGAAVRDWMGTEGYHQLLGLMLRLEHLPGPGCVGGTHPPATNPAAHAAGPLLQLRHLVDAALGLPTTVHVYMNLKPGSQTFPWVALTHQIFSPISISP